MCQNITMTSKETDKHDHTAMKRIVAYSLMFFWILLWMSFIRSHILRSRFYSKIIKKMEMEENKRNEMHLYQMDLLERNQKKEEIEQLL